MRANSASATVFSALASRSSAISSGLSMTRSVAPAATFSPRLTAIFASRPEPRAAMSIRGAFGFALNQERLRFDEVPDR
jgi:hypothetical protein